MLAFLCQKKCISISYTSQWLTQMHTLALFLRIDESANSFTNTSLLVIHFLLVYTFQVTQEITNSLYIDIFNKISLNKTNKEAPLKAQCSFRCEKYKSKRSMLRMEASYFVDIFFKRENKRLAWRHCKEKLHKYNETKDNRCRWLPLNLRSGNYNV